MSKYNVANCEEIADIALHVSKPMTFRELADKLGYSSPHSVAPRISAAHDYYLYELGDEVTATAITYAFISEVDDVGYGRQP